MTHAKYPEFVCGLLLGLSLLFAATQSASGDTDKIYKWMDPNGTIQYTQLPPPPDVQVLEIMNAPPPANDAAAERARVQQETEALDERMNERQEATAKAELRAKNKEIRRQNCVTATKNLTELQQGGIKRYRTADGEVLRLSEDDRQKRIAETEKQITENCKD
jgi:Domain of unknown function (DUF4124)